MSTTMTDTQELETPTEAAERESILAGIAEMRSDEPAAEDEEKPEPKPDPPKGEEADEEDDDDLDSDDEEEEDDDLDFDDDADDDLDAEDDDEDADTKKRLALVQKQEKRAREALAAKEAEFSGRVAKWEEEKKGLAAKAEKLDSLAERFAVDPAGVALEIGIPEDAFEYAAEQFFRLSKKAADDPRHREAARLARLERKIAENAKKDKEREAKAMKDHEEKALQEQRRRDADAYMDKIGKMAKKSRIGAKLLEAQPDVTKLALGQVAIDIYQATGQEPTPKQVVKKYVKQKRAELKALGFDASSLGAKKGKAEDAEPAPKKKRASKAAADDATPSKSGPLSPEEEREQILRELRNMTQDE